jgi:Homing endonuclease associated repeat/HNH endonuclease
MTDFSIRNRTGRRYSERELIDAVRDVARDKDTKYLASRDFERLTGIAEGTVARRFGSWRAFCEAAGLLPRYSRSISREELFKNLEVVWLSLGRQPTAKEMKQPLSAISAGRYSRAFSKPWFDICVEFLSWRTGASLEEIGRRESVLLQPSANRVPRSISLSTRYEVLKRDGFRCQICGRSPAIQAGCVLHLDHVRHWSAGGTSEAANLRTLCGECNLGRGVRD